MSTLTTDPLPARNAAAAAAVGFLALRAFFFLDALTPQAWEPAAPINRRPAAA